MKRTSRLILNIAGCLALAGMSVPVPQAVAGSRERDFHFEYKATVKGIAAAAKTVDRWIPLPNDSPFEGDPWSDRELMQPQDLVRLLSGEQKPVVLQIGVVHLYRLSHIPGSRYAGPANASDGVDLLKKEAQAINRNSQLVYYCGCCPWADCPNIRPAYKALKEMGFKNVKVLYLPQSFTQDWVMKGLPVEKGA